MNFLITGGTGGLGKALVAHLAGEGHQVAFTWSQNEQAANDLEQTTGGKATGYQLDLAQAETVEDLVADAIDRMGQIDVLVNNAAAHASSPAAWLDIDDWRRVIDINLTGAFILSQAVLDHFLAQRFGRFIHVGSVAAKGLAGDIAYAASKAGLEGLSATLAKEAGRYGVTSNVLCLGLAEDGMGNGAVSQKVADHWARYCPVGRAMTADDFVRIIDFLAHKNSSFINGAVLPVHGGLDGIFQG